MKVRREWPASVVRVGEGRGFIVEAGNRRLVVTAVHCLPELPPVHGWSHREERTYPNLLGRLGQGLDVWAECLFADPIADIAVLSEPDNQALHDEAEAYERLTASFEPFRIAEIHRGAPGSLLALGGQWFKCTVKVVDVRPRALWVTTSREKIRVGLPGSPILNGDGYAVGVVSIGRRGLNPSLADSLPAWLVQEFGDAEVRDGFSDAEACDVPIHAPLDSEITPLVEALRADPWCTTQQSCWGHGERVADICLVVRGIDGLRRFVNHMNRIRRRLDPCDRELRSVQPREEAVLNVSLIWDETIATCCDFDGYPNQIMLSLTIESAETGPPSAELLGEIATMYRDEGRAE